VKELMLIGKYYHRLEEHHRVSLPKKFREEGSEWIITRGLDGCLFLFKPTEFEAQLAEISARSLTKKTNRDLVRLMANEAENVAVDANGRVHLPEYLTAFAHLTKDLVVVGSLNRIEIWDVTTYHTYVDQLETQAEAIAEAVQTPALI
jgi:MraZ protein